MANLHVRPVLAHESALVFSFLYLAARMDEAGEPIQKALTDPHLARYWAGWGRDGDLGVVALEDGMATSCAWVRLFAAEGAGYGFVADDVPELATGTVDGFRGKGTGTATLAALIAAAKGRFPGISLSVRETNPAVRLYERFGFSKVAGSAVKNRVGTTSFKMLLSFKE